MLFFSTRLEIIGSATAAAVAALALIALFWLTWARRHPVIRAHSYSFLCLSLLGTLSASLSVFSWPQDGLPVLCLVRPWAFTIPAYLIVCPILATQFRAHRIFNRTSLSQSRLFGTNNYDLLLLVIATIIPQIAINAVWQSVAPLQSFLTADGQQDCLLQSNEYEFVWISIGWFGCIVLASVYLNIRLVKVAQEFKQSRSLFAACFLIASGAALLVTLQLFHVLSSAWIYGIRTMGMLSVLLLLLCTQVLPKLRAIMIHDQRSDASSAQAFVGPARLPMPLLMLKSLTHAIATDVPASRSKHKELQHGSNHQLSISQINAKLSQPHLAAPATDGLALNNNDSASSHCIIDHALVEIVIDEKRRRPQQEQEESAFSISRPSSLMITAKHNKNSKQANLKHANGGQLLGLSSPPAQRHALPSLKAALQASNTIDSSISSSSSFKTALEDHISFLFTPAAVAIEQVPLFVNCGGL